MKATLGLLGLFLCCASTMANDAVGDLSPSLGATPALVVVVCDGEDKDLSTVTGLVEQTPWTIFLRGPDSAGLDTIRDWAREHGHLGSRVSVAADDGPSLWLAGDMADAVWVAPGVDNRPTKDEILRVLRPGGICISGDDRAVKPAAEGVDQWRHPYHGPDNNIVSEDMVARLPGELRFQTYPVFAPMPEQTLFAGGRIFFFAGHIAFHEREESILQTLTVLNAYNGLKLWTRKLGSEFVVHNISKVATDDELVFSEGKDLWMLDTATGAELGKFQAPADTAAAGDTDWKWIAQEGDVLWAAFGPPDARVAPHKQKSQMGHWPWGVANQHYNSIVNQFGDAQTLAAYSYPDMKLLWSERESEPFDARALCMEGGRILQLAPERYMAARDAETGKELWRHTIGDSKDLFDAIGTSIKRQGWGLGWATYCCTRAGNGVVCIAGPSFRNTIGIDFTNGELLWTTPDQSPHPFFIGDDLYIMPRVANPSVTCRQIDPRTGEPVDEFALGVIGSCTRLTATPNQFYYRPGGGVGRTVYSDVGSRKLADYQGIVRPGCFDGVVPANGRLYWMPLACDCWQVHGTFSMAPRVPRDKPTAAVESSAWLQPSTTGPAAQDDWPMFRATSSGTATVATSVGKAVKELWRRNLPSAGPTAPVSAVGRVFVADADGTVRGLDAESGETLWTASTAAGVLYPPVYWNGRVVYGACDGVLYCLDAADGSLLGSVELAPERRFINIMDRFISAWPLGGGVVLDNEGVAYTAAGSTAADGAVAAAIDLTTGKLAWRQEYTLDGDPTKLSFGVQGNLLLKNDKLYINGGAPVGFVALDAATGGNPQVAAQMEAGMDTFIEPDGALSSAGPELYSNESAMTTIFKRHQGRVHFPISDRRVALIRGRLFCSREIAALDRVVDVMNTDPTTGKKLGGGGTTWDVMKVPVDDAILWASDSSDLRGLAFGSDGVVVLHEDSVEALSADGKSLWTAPLSGTPVRWGLALTGDRCLVTLTDGTVVCLAKE